jgi:hypothetical protein
MKKLILLLFVVATVASTSFAQISLKGGLNLANQSFEESGISIEPDSKIGFLLGVNYASKLSESLAIRPGIQLSTKGSKFNFGGTDKTTNTFTYIEVPLDLVFSSGDLSIHAGPYLGLLMSAKSEGEDIKEFIKSSDFGLNLGLGYNFGKIGLGLNYGLGLANINDDPDSADGTIKNKAISIYLTYTL